MKDNQITLTTGISVEIVARLKPGTTVLIMRTEMDCTYEKFKILVRETSPGVQYWQPRGVKGIVFLNPPATITAEFKMESFYESGEKVTPKASDLIAAGYLVEPDVMWQQPKTLLQRGVDTYPPTNNENPE